MVSTALPTDVPTYVPELVDWQLAARVGRRVAGGSELPVRAAWSRQFTELSTTADQAVAEFTGLGGDLPPPVAEPLDRGEWVEANLATLRRILRPLAEKVAERKAWKASGPVPTAMRTSTRAIAGAQAGTLLGYVGQRVLGQYFVRDFHAASLELVFGVFSLLFGVGYAAHYLATRVPGQAASAGVVMAAALPVILGAQFLLQAMNFDVLNVPSRPIHPYLAVLRELATEEPAT